LLQWIKKTLIKDWEIEDIRIGKFNYIKDDYLSTVFLPCPHELLKVFFFTGARIGAFIPNTKYRNQRGLYFLI
jgi:hypothetical protein